MSIDDVVEVGRDCDGLQLEDPTVSRRHLRLDPTAAGLVLEDLNSANGTFVDGQRVTEPTLLKAGQRVRLGETEIVVHPGHKTDHDTAGPTGADIVTDRVSEEARRLSAASRKLGRPGRLRPESGSA
ncbi:MAG: FHA domain-containing protein [Acidimicrobiales bacterium]|nr:FHA domain-containing protein [Acidimicrobiales bacterium]